MSDKFSLQAFARSFSRPHPARDWAIILAVIILIGCGLLGYAAYMFFGIRTGAIAGAAEEERTALPSVTREEVNAALEAYDARRVNFEARNFPLSEISDPARNPGR